MSRFETRGPEFRYPSMKPFAPLADADFPRLQDSSRARAEALFDDPRQFESQEVSWDSDSGYHDWSCELTEAILDRSADAYNPDTSYLGEGIAVLMAERFSDPERLRFLRAQLDGDLKTLRKLLGPLTALDERWALKHRCDSFNHFDAQLLGNGEARIVMDQRHLSRSRVKANPAARVVFLVAGRTGRRDRASRGMGARRRGSRRTPSRSTGGGSSGSDEPPGDSSGPALGRHPHKWGGPR